MEKKPESNNSDVTEEKQEHSSVFRSKSIDRISSPEQLNDYIRVASPRMWMVLIAVVVFLLGGVIWASLGRIESTVQGVAIVDEGNCTVYVAREKAALLKAGDDVRINDVQTTLTGIPAEPFAISGSFSEYARSIGGFALGEWVYAMTTDSVQMPDGIYSASVVEERITPFSLLTDKD